MVAVGKFGMVGMHGVSVVARNKEAVCDVSAMPRGVKPRRGAHALKQAGKEGGCRALLCLAADFLVVKDCADINLTCRFCGKESF